MLTHDRPLGRWARPRRDDRDLPAGAPSPALARRQRARRLTNALAVVAGAGVGLPMLLTWVRTSGPGGEELPWVLVLLSWAWAGLLALVALLFAVWTAPARSAPPASVTASFARRLQPRRGDDDLVGRSPAGPSPRRGRRVVALVAGLTAVALLVLSQV